MPEAAPLEPGDPRALGQYEVVGRLGAGGQGAVYLGRTSGGEDVAIKVLHAQFAADPSARARFVREVSAAQKVAPFCTAKVIEADVQGDRPYIVSEFIDGPSLHDVVAQSGPLDADELEPLAIGTVTALAAIHEAGIVHRDFKPNNVLLAADGPPRVVDFGIARTVNSQESAVTATGMVVGTPGYLAPEQLTGAQLTGAVDIFAWGATMVFAATGESPFEADTLPVIINRILHDDPDLSALPEPLRGMVGRCLSKDAALRPAATPLLLQLLGHVGAAPVGPAPDAEELLGEGTRIAAQLSPPPAVSPAPAPGPPTPPPAPLGPPPMPIHQGPPTPPPMPIRQGPPTPPPMPAVPPPPYQGPVTPQPAYMQAGPPPPHMQAPPPHMQPPMQRQQPPMQPHMQPPMPQGPQGPLPPYGYRPPAAPRGSNGPVIAAVGCSVIVLLVIVLGVVIAAVNANRKKLTYTPPSVHYTFPSYTPFGGYGVNQAFDGTWTGTGYQTKPTRSQWSIDLTLRSGSTLGTVKYDDGRCNGSLIMQSSTAIKTELRELVYGTNCATTGYVTLRYVSSDTLRYEWRQYDSDTTPAATGTLTKG